MVNHADEGAIDCNCKRCFDHTGAIIVVTTRAIAAGEELRFSYASPKDQPNLCHSDQRTEDEQLLQADLMVKYGVSPKSQSGV